MLRPVRIDKPGHNRVWLTPIVFLPLVINVKSQAFIDITTTVKWALICPLAVWLGLFIFGPDRLKSPDRSEIGLSLPAALFCLFFIGLALGVTYTVNPGEGLNRLAFWLTSGAGFLASVRATRCLEQYPRYLQWALTVSALILCVRFLYDLKVNFPNPGFDRHREFSLIGHFNLTADVLMVLMPMLVWTALTCPDRLIRIAAGFCFASTCVMLMASGSLGGMIGFGGGAVVAGTVWIQGLLRQRQNLGLNLSRRKGGHALLVAVAISAVILLAYQNFPENLRKRIFERGEWWSAPKAADLSVAKSLPPLAPLWLALTPALGSRTPMWAATSGMIAEHPWRGFGTGSYEYEYRSFGKRYDVFRDPEILGINAKTNPHNVFLQIASENGLPMAVLFVGLYAWLTVKVTQQAIKHGHALWLSGLWALVAAGLDAQVNHTFLYPASLLICAVVFGFLYGNLPAPRHRIHLPAVLKHPEVGYLAIGLSFVLASFPLRWVVSEYYASQAYILALKHPATSPREVKYDWQAAREWFPDNVFALYGLANTCLNQKNLKCTEVHLREVLALSPYHTPALNLLAHVQLQTGRVDEAEATLHQVLRIDPDSQTVKENLESVIKLKGMENSDHQESPD